MTPPLIVHTTNDPFVLRHRRSLRPSALKSPAPATLHEASGVTALPPDVRAELETIVEPFMVHSASVPEVSRHNRSALPSALKSVVATTLQLAPRATGAPPNVTVLLPPMAPFWPMSQNARLPLVLRHMMSLT